jgi:hypothetical protein
MSDIEITSRKTIRMALAAFLRAQMTTPKNVLDHIPADLTAHFPATCVTGAPTDRQQEFGDGSLENKFGLGIRNITAYNIDAQPAWTPKNAEDMLDTLEYELTLALRAASQASLKEPWTSIQRNGLSIIEGPYKIGGISYLSETVPVIVQVSDGGSNE